MASAEEEASTPSLSTEVAQTGPVASDRSKFYELAYQESVRGLTQQAGVLESARTRSGLLITAANVVTALLATPAIRDRPGLGIGGWAAVVAFGVTMVASLYILWPRGRWSFAFDAKKLIEMIEGPKYDELWRLHKRLADLNQDSITAHRKRLGRMFVAFQIGAISLGVEVILWVLVLAKVTVNGEVL
ncbi:MAG TPA: hypothetical protein VFU17_04535 [Candidatus Limnocylindrales bacterium]|nr:hypothetical protein [Candidatus Limnocylindrales bacterium]